MLVRLSIRDIVLIDALDLDFSGGLTTLTGETGAGNPSCSTPSCWRWAGAATPRWCAPAARGARCAHRSRRAPIIPPASRRGNSGSPRDGELILRREQAADGRTRAFVNDTPVSAQALRAIGQELVEIHCQHDERAMVDPAAHRQLVDAHGGLTRQVEALRALHGAMQARAAAL